MKLSIIATKPDGQHQLELLAAAQAAGLDAAIRNVTRQDLCSGKPAAKLKGAVIWRSSDLDIRSERASLAPYLQGKIVASDGVFHYPMLRFKFYQQQLLAAEKATAAWSIPTHRFASRAGLQEAIETGVLQLPVIAKPNAGSRGEGIYVLQEIGDIQQIVKPLKYVFQDFIPNDCDWRIIVIGGTAVGFLRRSAADGSFLNNVSQGAMATIETDQLLCSQLSKIATKAASMFHLSFCGVDIIRNRETGKLQVLEVNTAPQWRDEFGFKSVTGVDVPAKLINWIVAKQTAAKQPLATAVEDYYKARFADLHTDAFHFASRLWLWTNDTWARQQLDQNQAEYIGTTPEDIDSTIRQIIEKAKTKPVSVNQNKAHRKEAFATHAELPLYNALLFKTVFCDSVYDLDIRPYIRKYISDKDLLQLFETLITDQDAVRLLSTHAVNFFYLLRNYFKQTLSLSSAVMVSPYELLELLPGYAALEQKGIIDHRTSVKLQIYLLTHAIIGESRFYARPVRASAFRKLCEQVERLIADNYFDVSLDNKFEFLVCASLTGYKSDLRSQIEQEAEKSVSWAGNFLVDTTNSFADNKLRHCLRTSEHRNVLFLMSQKAAVFQAGTSANSNSASGLAAKPRVIGRLARVSIPSYDVRRAIARVDSGATRSAIAASDMREDADGLHFTLFDPASHLYTGRVYTVKNYQQIAVKNTINRQQRYAVQVDIVVNDETYRIWATLADRTHMLYPILLGRNFLKGNYIVDTSKQFVRPKSIVREQS